MQTAGELPRRLGALDATSIVAGSVIGAGIFLVPGVVARSLPAAGAILAIWIATGALSLCGALALAELGAMMPATGGQYVFLREAYGPLPAFLYGWTLFAVIWGGALATLASGFAIYLSYFIPLTPVWSKAASVTVLAIFTWVNYRGVKPGAVAQNLFTALKIAGLLILTASALFSPATGIEWSLAPVGFSWPSLGGPMMACLFAYEGWNSVSFVAGEVRAPERNLPRALALGMALVIGIFTLANVAFLRVLAMAEFAAAERVGAVVAERVMGPAGAALISATILAAIVGSLNACLLTGPRVYFAQARDRLFFARFGGTHPRFQTPAFSIVAQGALAAALVVSGTFDLLLSYATFGAWVFHLLTVGAVIVLRRRQPARERPYRMWGYPVTPALFCAVAAGFLASSPVTQPRPTLTGLLLIAAGVPLYYLWRRKASTP